MGLFVLLEATMGLLCLSAVSSMSSVVPIHSHRQFYSWSNNESIQGHREFLMGRNGPICAHR